MQYAQNLCRCICVIIAIKSNPINFPVHLLLATNYSINTFTKTALCYLKIHNKIFIALVAVVFDTKYTQINPMNERV